MDDFPDVRRIGNNGHKIQSQKLRPLHHALCVYAADFTPGGAFYRAIAASAAVALLMMENE